jgi:hydrogenase nickel incorporation protein HypA/HybF
MHEFALAQNIVDTIENQVTKDLHKVTKINISVGKFSGIVSDSLEFGLKAILADKNHGKVVIEIKNIPTIAQCECGKEYPIVEIFAGCPSCSSFNRKIISGLDILIDSIELLEE